MKPFYKAEIDESDALSVRHSMERLIQYPRSLNVSNYASRPLNAFEVKFMKGPRGRNCLYGDFEVKG